jgi:hypothetical protein
MLKSQCFVRQKVTSCMVIGVDSGGRNVWKERTAVTMGVW